MNPRDPQHSPLPGAATQPPQPAAQPANPAQQAEAPSGPVDPYNFDPRMRVQMSNEPGVVHIERPIEPQSYEISEELQKKHDASKRMFPELNLSRGEYVIIKLHRHPIGLFVPVVVTTFALCILVSIWIMYPVVLEANPMVELPTVGALTLFMLLLAALVGVFGYIAVWIYMRNRFFMTNESIVQEIQHSLFSRHEQTVSLGSVEDVSFVQRGVLQTMLNYGMIRLSTEGEETTYRFYFVSNPKQQVAILNNAVEDFKNGRPVTGHL